MFGGIIVHRKNTAVLHSKGITHAVCCLLRVRNAFLYVRAEQKLLAIHTRWGRANSAASTTSDCPGSILNRSPWCLALRCKTDDFDS